MELEIATARRNANIAGMASLSALAYFPRYWRGFLERPGRRARIHENDTAAISTAKNVSAATSKP